MEKRRLGFVACILVAGLAACDAPAIVTPGGPTFDNGHTFGGGKQASPDTTGNTTTVISSTETTAEQTAERDGGTFGGGN